MSNIATTMKRGRYATSRQKACEQCVRVKTKCRSTPEGCARCIERNLTCSLRVLQNTSQNQLDNNVDIVESQPGSLQHVSQTQINEDTDDNQIQTNPGAGDFELQAVSQMNLDSGGLESQADSQIEIENHVQSQLPPQSNGETGEVNSQGIELGNLSTSFTTDDVSQHAISPTQPGSQIDAPDIELICTIDAKAIRNRWLNALASGPDQTAKEYPATVVSFISRMLKSYTAATVRGHNVPPFLHPNIAGLPAIQRCLALVQTCSRFSGCTAAMLGNVVEEQIKKSYDTPDYPIMRQEFQANLIYMMVLYFCYERDEDAKSLFRRGMMNLQDLAHVSSELGIVCVAERNGECPTWEAWVAAETQRRCLYLMYMFDNLLSAKDGLQTFLGTELAGLPAPSAKDLWYARNSVEWERAYRARLENKTIPGISIDYLWPVPAELSPFEKIQRRGKVDRWLEDVDEFGTMLYAVTCCTHGE